MKYLLCLAVLCAAPALFAAEGAYVLDHKMKDIKGNDINLEDYKGKVILMVNVASKCGLTPQYSQLVKIHQQYKDKGLVVMGFPANQFMGQEPGSDEEIMTFCVKEYNVDFDMMSKIVVKGDGMAPLYDELTSKEANGDFGGDIPWNFTKFLVGKDGKVVARFGPRTKPDAPEVVKAIEQAL